MTEPTSESTIGLDLGDRWSRYCVIDSRGVVVKEDRVRSNPEALEETFRVILPCRIVIEAGTHSPWVSRLLERLGHQVIVANARKVRLIYESNPKNDRVDAQMLAKLGRVDVSLLAPVQHRSAGAGEGDGRTAAGQHDSRLCRQGGLADLAAAEASAGPAAEEYPTSERADPPV